MGKHLVCSLLKKTVFWSCFIVLLTPLTSLNRSCNSNSPAFGNRFDEKKLPSNVLASKEEISSDVQNYRFKAPSGRFLVKDVDGQVEIGFPVRLNFDSKAITIPNFDYYRVVDSEGKTLFYQADTANLRWKDSPFVYVGITANFSNSGISQWNMNVQYGDSFQLVLFNINASLSPAQFSFFDSISKTTEITNDELSNRLKASSNVIHEGERESLSQKKTSSPNIFTSNVAPHSFDSYTDSDGIINRYVSDFLDKASVSDPNKIYTDDPIVRIIPKELCFILGEHTYIGKEYGFFIRVRENNVDSRDYDADVLIVDIVHTLPSFPSKPEGSTKIVPLFQYRYRAVDRSKREDWSKYDPNLQRIVTLHYQYMFADYYISNPGFRITLLNVGKLNEGDPGYVPTNDDGPFFIQGRYSAHGVGTKAKRGSFVKDTFIFAAGFVPYVGNIVSVCSYLYETYKGFQYGGQYLYDRSADVIDGESKIETYETNNTDQIAMRGHLVKSITITSRCDNDSPRLINVGGFANGTYVIARSSNSNNNSFSVIESVSFDVLEDNTSAYWFFGWHPQGELIRFGRATGTYCVSLCRPLQDIETLGLPVAIDEKTDRKLLRFIPKNNGEYRFETNGDSADPFFIVYDLQANQTYNAIDDIEGSKNRNARLDAAITAGHVYHIVVFNYGSGAFTLSVFYTPKSQINLELNVNTSVVLDQENFKVLKFAPKYTDYYDIFTKNSTGDPYLYLLDSSGKILEKNDDGLSDRNSLITYLFQASHEYFVVVQSYNSKLKLSATICAIPSIRNRASLTGDQNVEIILSNNTQSFRFVASENATYQFNVSVESGLVSLELYDANRMLIASNRSAFGTNAFSIKQKLVAQQNYYLYFSPVFRELISKASIVVLKVS